MLLNFGLNSCVCLFLCFIQNQRDQNYTVLRTKSNIMTVEGLKPGTTYVFRVRAHTDGGYGNYGGEIELETRNEGRSQLNSTHALMFYLFITLHLGISYCIFLVGVKKFKVCLVCVFTQNWHACFSKSFCCPMSHSIQSWGKDIIKTTERANND